VEKKLYFSFVVLFMIGFPLFVFSGNCPVMFRNIKMASDPNGWILVSETPTPISIQDIQNWHGQYPVNRSRNRERGDEIPRSSMTPTITPTPNSHPVKKAKTVPATPTPVLWQETTLWKVTGKLVDVIKEDDMDYHLVIVDGLGNSMIAEIVDPGCANLNPPTHFPTEIAAVRTQFEADLFKWTGIDYSTVNSRLPIPLLKSYKVTIMGPAFFDNFHKQRNSPANCAEIHPVLEFK
jgi:hypothetical protein